jgi:hypothetical protein
MKTTLKLFLAAASMNKRVIGVLAVSVVCGLAAATGATTNLQSPGGAGVHVKRLDSCPYYPSPVVCRDRSAASATQGN